MHFFPKVLHNIKWMVNPPTVGTSCAFTRMILFLDGILTILLYLSMITLLWVVKSIPNMHSIPPKVETNNSTFPFQFSNWRGMFIACNVIGWGTPSTKCTSMGALSSSNWTSILLAFSRVMKLWEVHVSKGHNTSFGYVLNKATTFLKMKVLKHMSDLMHEFGICLHILVQIIICRVHEVTKFAPRNVVKILWNEFQLKAFLEEFPCVAMGFPFLLPHCPPPCWNIAFSVGLGKFHGWMLPNFGGMNVVFHFRKPNIHNLLILDPIKIPRFCGLESYTFRWSSFEGLNQLSEIGPIHLK